MAEESKHDQDVIIELLSEFSKQREQLTTMITDLEKLKGKIETLIPATLDVRYSRLFEEKVKSLTAFFGTLLEIRKEIMKSIKDEIEIRRKIEKGDELEEDLQKIFDIRALAKKVESFKDCVEPVKNRLEQTSVI